MNLLEKTIAILKADDWKYQLQEDGSSLVLYVIGKHGRYKVFIRIHENRKAVIVYSDVPLMVPEDKRAAIGELVARLNDRIMFGAFEFDYDDGMIIYRTSGDYRGVEDMDGSAIMALIQYTIRAADDNFPSFIAVLFNGTEPRAALIDPQDLGKRTAKPAFNLN